MGDFVIMQIADGMTYFKKNIGHLIFLKPFPFMEQTKKGPIRHTFHYHVNICLVIKEIVQLYNAWMITEKLMLNLCCDLILKLVLSDHSFCDSFYDNDETSSFMSS